MSLKIYTLTHKKFDVPKDPMYIPLQVGRKIHEDLGYIGDNTGDHISQKNIYYSELTGHYWIWKNVTDVEYVGVCHYRRYLINEQEQVFTQKELLKLLETYDIITTKKVLLPNPYYDGYKATHHVENLDITAKVIKELYPDYYDIYDKTIHSDETYFGNIMICKKTLFDEYCTWLFSIFGEMEKQVFLDGYDDYHKRVYGFISEILLLVYVRKNQLKAYECKVGMIGEKVETRELKQKLYQDLEKKDYKKAKEKFIESYKQRPDLLMEASDITGELKLVVQIIATCELEEANKKETILSHFLAKEDIIAFFHKLNQVMELFRKNGQIEDITLFLKDTAFHVSEEAMYVSLNAMCAPYKSFDSVGMKFLEQMEKEKQYVNIKHLQKLYFHK